MEVTHILENASKVGMYKTYKLYKLEYLYNFCKFPSVIQKYRNLRMCITLLNIIGLQLLIRKDVNNEVYNRLSNLIDLKITKSTPSKEDYVIILDYIAFLVRQDPELMSHKDLLSILVSIDNRYTVTKLQELVEECEFSYLLGIVIICKDLEMSDMSDKLQLSTIENTLNSMKTSSIETCEYFNVVIRLLFNSYDYVYSSNYEKCSEFIKSCYFGILHMSLEYYKLSYSLMIHCDVTYISVDSDCSRRFLNCIKLLETNKCLEYTPCHTCINILKAKYFNILTNVNSFKFRDGK